MKKDKKLQVKAEKETIRKAMILAISAELKSIAGIHSVNSPKLEKSIEKGAKKLAKNLVKDIKVKLVAAVEGTPPAVKEKVAKTKNTVVKETEQV
ncbi:hypothetical protein [Pedobacter sp. GR22-6]|uniref:hypothetical protein n=1 Tax=Pedobacter sp. GR22-6 TaxID=3127957 RepID=UPI00307E5861